MQQRATEWNQTQGEDTASIHEAPALLTKLPGQHMLQVLIVIFIIVFFHFLLSAQVQHNLGFSLTLKYNPSYCPGEQKSPQAAEVL